MNCPLSLRWRVAVTLLFAGLRFGVGPVAQVSAAQPADTASPGLSAVPTGFRPAKLTELDGAIDAAIERRATPGAVLWIERQGTAYHRAYGRRAVEPKTEAMTEDTVFDAASLTKVLATTPAVMQLIEQNRVRVDAPLATYLSEFTGEGRDAVTVRHLLTHTSGLRPGLGLRPEWSGYDEGIRRALAEKPEVPPNTRFRYSDINFILLGELVRRVSGESLDAYCAAHVYAPLRMTHTTFRPDPALKPRIAPTTLEGEVWLRGVVHDPTSRRMGGVAGHAGLFTTAADTARFARMMLAGGSLEGATVFRPETVRRMTEVQTPPGLTDSRRGFGWDIDSPYAGPRGEHLPIGSYGHSGWTGTSLWIDPFSGLFVILLANRNHPSEDGNILPLRRQVATLAAEAVGGFNFVGVPGALPKQNRTAPRPGESSATAGSNSVATAGNAVKNGIDTLISRGYAPLRKKKIGLITNHTGIDRERNPTIDLLRGAPDVELKALFSPEHGIRGQLDAKIADGLDARTGLPVFSLYGETRQPKPEQLAGLDALVFDIQDVGCRFYTYIATMGLCLEAASRQGLEFIVLDRVNPIDGSTVEGPVYTGTTNHFVAFHALPLRHGMTVGELARMFVAERGWKARLEIVPVEGWRRNQGFDATGLPWVNTSPNMRSLKQAYLYPGVGLLESAVSVGRGTDTPFEVVGAPYVDDRRLAAELNRAGLPGVGFVPIRFTPKASVFQDQECRGVYLMLNDRDACRAVDVGLTLALVFQRLHPQQFALDKIGPLLQHPPTLAAIREGKPLSELKTLWATDLAEFQARRSSFLLY